MDSKSEENGSFNLDREFRKNKFAVKKTLQAENPHCQLKISLRRQSYVGSVAEKVWRSRVKIGLNCLSDDNPQLELELEFKSCSLLYLSYK